MNQPGVPLVKPHGLSRWWLIVFVLIILSPFAISLSRSASQQPLWSLTRVAKAAQGGQIARIDVGSSDTMVITLTDGSRAYSVKDPASPAPEQLRTLGVSPDQLEEIEWSSTDNWNDIVTILIYLLPLIGIIGVIVWLLSRVIRYDPKG